MADNLPPICNILYGGSSSFQGGGPPSNVTNANQTSTSTNANTPPRMALQDICFIPNATVEFTVLGLVIIFYIPSIYFYIKYRNNLLIKYRQPKVVIFAAVLSAIMSILVPIFRYNKVSCYVNTWTINLLVFSCCIITYSRYVRTYYIQQLSIFKLQFGESKNSSRAKERKNIMRTDPTRTKEFSLSQQWEATTLKANSSSKISSFLTMDTIGITDPILYFKKLNQIINKKIVIILVIIPIVFLFIYSIVITFSFPDTMVRHCSNEHQYVGTPKLILSVFIVVSSIFIFYQAYYKQKWDTEIRTEYTVYIIFLIICNILMQLTVRGYINDTWVKYRMYIFHVFTAIVHYMCVVTPLLKIAYKKIRNKELKLTEEEFLTNLSNTNFKAQVKEIATNTFCIENVLFFEAHCDLMNMVITYYSKKNNIPGMDTSVYSCSDVLHKNTINPILYKPFDNIFKPQYEQVYNLYIKEDGIAFINIKSSTIKAIEEQMENDNFSYLMFNDAAEEVGEILYSNIYPRMKDSEIS